MNRDMKTRSGIEITQTEEKLIKALQRVAKMWKKDGGRMWLYSGSGTLHVMLDDGINPRFGGSNPSREGYNPDNIITEICIPNDGGDW